MIPAGSVSQHSDIVHVSVFIKEQRIDRQQTAEIYAKVFKTCHLFYLLCQETRPLLRALYSENARIQAIPVQILKQPLKRNKLPALRQKVPAPASPVQCFLITNLLCLIQDILFFIHT